jgi:hypothetical protein
MGTTEQISLKIYNNNYNMLQYNIKLETVKKSLLFFVQKETCNLYNIHHTHREFKFNDFIMNIAVHYVLKFNEEFSEYINYDTVLQLECAARNIGYALKTYFKVNPNCTLSNLDKFANEFITIQFDDFDNWCYDLYLSYCEEQKKKNV